MKNNLLGDEFHNKYNLFRFKKLNIFTGTNATGKTSLIKAIHHVLFFLNKKESTSLSEIVDYNFSSSLIQIDFIDSIDNDEYLQRLIISTINEEDLTIKIAYKKTKLLSNSSYENSIEKFEQMPNNFIDYIEFLNENKFNIGWFAQLPSAEEQFNKVKFIDNLTEEENEEYLKILFDVLNTLDSSIVGVKKSLDSSDTFVIEHQSNKLIIVQKGMDLSSIPVLSSGTKYGINIANLMYSIKNHRNGIYLIDEQFSYISSDIEVALLAKMVSLLGPNEQIFFTTHNTDILSLSFPIHSYYFSNKKDNNISVLCAADFENRNNVSVKNLYDNDVFGVAPDVSKIYNI